MTEEIDKILIVLIKNPGEMMTSSIALKTRKTYGQCISLLRFMRGYWLVRSSRVGDSLRWSIPEKQRAYLISKLKNKLGESDDY